MAATETVRRITIQGTSTGLGEVAAKLRDVSAAQGDVARSSDAVGVSTETMGRKQLSAVTAFDKLQRQLDETYRAQSAYARINRDLDRASAQGLVGEQRRAELLSLAATRYGSATAGNDNYRRSIDATAKSTGLARFEMINFGRQLGDIGTMAAMGQSPFAILSSQGAQLADIFATTSGSMGDILKQLGGGIGRFAMSGTGLAAGGLAIGAGAVISAMSYASAQRDVMIALDGVGRSSGATIDGINRIAVAEAAAARISIASAREIASAFAATGKTDPSALPGLIGFSKNYATAQGLGMDEAAKELAQVFSDPVRGAETLQGKLGGLSETTRRWIADLQASGDRLGASKAVLDVFSQSVAGASERTGYFAQTWANVRSAISNADDAMGKFASGIKTPLDQLEELTKRRAGISERSMAGSGFARQQAADLDAQIRQTQGLVELDRQRNDLIAKRAKADNASLEAGRVVEGLDPVAKNLRALQEQASALALALQLNPYSDKVAEWSRAQAALKTAIDGTLTSAERERQTGELAIRAVSARTVAERTAIAVERERLELSRSVNDVETARIRLLNEARMVQAQATREAEDALRVSRDQLAVAGKTPGERSRIEIDQRFRDNTERFGGVNPSMPAATAAANGLDAAFAESLRKLREAVPGLTITSGSRSYEQQAKLYAEKPGLAAPPGRSQHERGLAADLAYNGSGAVPAWVREKAGEFGIVFPLANRARAPEPWHVEPAGGRDRVATGGGSSVADEIRRNELTARDRNAIDSTLGNSNRELERQRELLTLSAAAWGKSSEEIAWAAKQQELTNSLQREGVAIGPALKAQIDATASGYADLVRQQEALRASQEALRTAGDLGRDMLRGVYGDLRAGASGAEIATNAFDRLANKLMEMALNDLFKPFGGTGMGLFGSNGFFSGLFGGFGGGSSLGTTPGTGGTYSEGGYTGAGSKWQPAGVVHRGEVVWSQADVSRAGGVGVVEAMRRGVPGYAEGGSPGFSRPAYSGAAANSNTVPQVIVNNHTGQEARVEHRQDGSLEVIIGQVEGRMAERVVRQQGSMSTAMRSVNDGRQLRG